MQIKTNIASKALPSHTIIASEYSTYPQDVVRASFMFATNYIKYFNERIRSSIFSLLCRLHQSDNLLFINYLHTDIHFKSCIHILEVAIIHITFVLCFLIKFLIFFIFTNIINQFPDVFIQFVLTLQLYLYVGHIIALIVLYVLIVFFIFCN